MIQIRNVKKSFGKNEVLKDVSLEVKDGEVVVILGPSGSGKTTLLRCLEFFEKADAGELEIGDLSVNIAKANKKEIQQVRNRFGFVFQNYNLFANKTVLENVTEGLIVSKKIPKKEAEEIAAETLKWVGLSDKFDAFPAQLSGGQQQRVGIARAVAIHPEAILLDEPTSALDPELVGDILDIIKKVAKKGITMIIVTHEISFAQDVADKVVFMDSGVVVEEGPPNKILSNPKEQRTRQFLSRIISLDANYVI